jgi:hypothetical protein
MSPRSIFPSVKRERAALGAVDDWRFVDTLVRDVDPGKTYRIPKGSSLFVRGWALLPEPPRPAASVVISVGRELRFEASYGKLRPDIAAFYGGSHVGECGFTTVSKLAGVRVGKHDLVIDAVDADGGAHELVRRSFEVLPSREMLAGKSRATRGRMHVSIDGVATLRDPAAFDGTVVRASVGDVVYIRGWAVDMDAAIGLSGVFGVFDDEEFVLGVHGLPREDAAAAISLPRARRCGFTLRMPTRNMPPGPHTIDLAIVAADGKSYHTHRVGTLELRAG